LLLSFGLVLNGSLLRLLFGLRFDLSIPLLLPALLPLILPRPLFYSLASPSVSLHCPLLLVLLAPALLAFFPGHPDDVLEMLTVHDLHAFEVLLIEFGLPLFQDEGKRVIDFPDAFPGHFDVEVTEDGFKIPAASLSTPTLGILREVDVGIRFGLGRGVLGV
jgi:hypothetical protein